MSIIRKLIIYEWFSIFFKSTLILFLLVSIANLVGGFLRENVTTAEVLLNHFIEIPSYLNKIFPISCLVSSLFCINKLKDRNELTAIFASGFSRKNFIISILYASSIVATILFFNNSYIDPFLKYYREDIIPGGEKKFRNLNTKGLKTKTRGTGKIWYKGSNYFFNFSTFDKSKKTLHDFTYFKFNTKNLLEEKITSLKLILRERSSPLAINGTHIKNLHNETLPTLKLFNKYVVPIAERSEDFKQIESDITTLNLLQLYSFIERLKKSGISTNEYLVLFYQKFSTAFVCIIFSLLSSINIFSPNRRGQSVGKNIVVIFLFTLVYWLINSYVIELGTKSKIYPSIACFGVPFLFILFIINIFYQNRKLS